LCHHDAMVGSPEVLLNDARYHAANLTTTPASGRKQELKRYTASRSKCDDMSSVPFPDGRDRVGETARGCHWRKTPAYFCLNSPQYYAPDLVERITRSQSLLCCSRSVVAWFLRRSDGSCRENIGTCHGE